MTVEYSVAREQGTAPADQAPAHVVDGTSESTSGSAADSPSPPVHPGQRRNKVLVICDHPCGLEEARSRLEGAGWIVQAHGSAREGKNAARAFQPDIILLSLELPGIDGVSTCRALRENEPYGSVPILVVAEEHALDTIRRAYRDGATDFISRPVDWDGLIEHLRFLVRGARMHLALAQSEERYRTLLEAVPGTMLVFDRAGIVHAHFPGSAPVTQLGNLALAPGHLSHFVPRSLSRKLLDAAREALEAGRVVAFETCDTKAGDERWHEVRVHRHQGDLCLALLNDVTERVLTSKQIQALAYNDALTGLPNRTRCVDYLAEALTKASAAEDSVQIVYMDLDSFKRINDTMGHNVGDEILRAVAGRLLRACKAITGAGSASTRTLVARVLGDEFAVIIDGPGAQVAVDRVVHAINHAMMAPFQHIKREIFITPSIGIAAFPCDGSDPEELLRNAHTALHEAKMAGRNTQRRYRSSMSSSTSDWLSMESSLRRALARGEFALHYQPKVEIGSGKVRGVEALLRWEQAGRGLLHPSQYIPLAEETGLIVPLGEWVLNEACGQMARWRKAGLEHLSVAVNVSSRQFTYGDVRDATWQACQAHGIEPAQLELELTESVMIGDVEQVGRVLRELKQMGVSISVDDFGTGYSSFAYLKRLGFDAVKIDRAFVRNLETEEEDRTICAAMIAMSKSLGLQVVAEGVETSGQYRLLAELGCHHVQGFVFSAPVSASELPAVIQRIETAAKMRQPPR